MFISSTKYTHYKNISEELFDGIKSFGTTFIIFLKKQKLKF